MQYTMGNMDAQVTISTPGPRVMIKFTDSKVKCGNGGVPSWSLLAIVLYYPAKFVALLLALTQEITKTPRLAVGFPWISEE